MKTNQTTDNILAGAPWLKPWQKRLVIAAAALAGAAVAMMVIRWFENRRLARLTATEQADADKN